MKKIIAKLLILFVSWVLIGGTINIDPTRPPKLKSASSIPNQPFELTAVFIHPQYSIAIINKKAVKVGDQIDEFTVTTIRPYTVELMGPQNIREVLQLVTPVIQKR
ncbi:MAG: hypothetical protein A3F42_07245 [Gammaproteobacteria bacterium RIFCSPHIGHO2_12_FULL_37_34]|nr:MAG: hypothetical protein A3F42_07245 [Gammaproteobacteria bacterium RIFCSPHIGHO2_12_FULL_37_34]